MENKYYYRLVPEWHSAFKILEDCCYDQLIYEGEQIGLIGRFDKENVKIGMLLCMCQDTPEILDFTKEEFDALLKVVNARRRLQQ